MIRTVLLFSLVSLSAAASPPAAHEGIALKAASTEAKPVVVTHIHQTPELKLATITMRAGAAMKGHAAPVPVTIIALQGEADIVMADGTKEHVAADRMVTLGPNVKHSVQATGKGPVLLLIHHVKPKTGGGKAHSH